MFIIVDKDCADIYGFEVVQTRRECKNVLQTHIIKNMNIGTDDMVYVEAYCTVTPFDGDVNDDNVADVIKYCCKQVFSSYWTAFDYNSYLLDELKQKKIKDVQIEDIINSDCMNNFDANIIRENFDLVGYQEYYNNVDYD